MGIPLMIRLADYEMQMLRSSEPIFTVILL